MDKLPENVVKAMQNQSLEEMAIKFICKNHRGKIEDKTIIAIKVFYGKVKYSEGEQWLINAYDLGKKDYKTYALKGIQKWIKFPRFLSFSYP